MMVPADIRNMKDAEAFIQEIVQDYDDKKVTRDEFMIMIGEYTTHICQVVTENTVTAINNQLEEQSKPKIILPYGK